MKKILFFLNLCLFLNGCSPDEKNFIGISNTAIKPLLIIFLVSLVVVIIFLVNLNSLEKKNVSFNFFEGLGYLTGPVLIAVICWISLVVSGFLLVSFYSTIFLLIAVGFGLLAFVVGYFENKKK